MTGPVDVAVVSLGTTPGLRRADDAFADQLRAAGLACEVRSVQVGRAAVLRRHPAATDLVEALAARRAAAGSSASFTIYSSVTAALLQRRGRPYAVRFDAPAALNRRGLGGAWQRRAERAALAGARLLLPWSEQASRAAPGATARIVVPVPIEEAPSRASRDIDALAYAGNPQKRGLDVLCAAWGAAGGDHRLFVGGIERERAVRWLDRAGVAEPPGVEWRGAVSHAEWLDTAARARLFVNASRWEDYGIAQLEALSAGAALVTVPSPGPYEALPLARDLAPELVNADLAAALRQGLALGEAELARYGVAAQAALAPYRPAAVLATVRERVVPLLGETA